VLHNAWLPNIRAICGRADSGAHPAVAAATRRHARPCCRRRGAFGAAEEADAAERRAPADATPEQLRQIIDQQNQTIARLSGCRSTARAATSAAAVCSGEFPTRPTKAKDLLKKICDVTGKGILTGQHNFPNERTLDTEAIHAATGKYPAIWGSDFGFTNDEDKDAITHRDLMIEEAKRHTRRSIIIVCWHMLRPTEDEPGAPGASWSGSVQARLTDDQWLELITSDSPLHRRWRKYMDTPRLSEAARGRAHSGPVPADA